ncbi:MAG: cytochrome c3 family protein [Alphaproteobacteria bacterium]|nr:cytochrome c3 family protein [Alphaproteobacteria bacterium]
MRRTTTTPWTALGLLVAVTGAAGCPDASVYPGDDVFQREPHSLFPEWPAAFDPAAKDWQLGSGMVDGRGLEQPIAFPHYTHVTLNGMQCEYCHQAARKSLHAGVPQGQTCMNCHTYVKKDSPEVQKVVAYFEKGEPVPWRKVHDLPDFVHFEHKRHVQAGVDCTECHGQMGLQGQPETWSEKDEHGKVVTKTGVRHPVVRETTLQMGWCLDCHASHPSVDENYGDKANLRRAELKDCWTCHK